MSYELGKLSTQARTSTVVSYKQLERVIDGAVGPFRIPLIAGNDSFNRVKMVVQQLAPNGFGLTNAGTYHFEFISTTVGDFQYLTPVPDFNRICFYDPLFNLDRLTITLYNPFNIITFPPDRGVYQVTNSGAVALFTNANGVASQLVTGNTVIVSNFNSSSNVINFAMNTNQVITVISSTSFTVNIDISSIAGTYNNVYVFYNDYRIDVPLVFRCLGAGA